MHVYSKKIVLFVQQVRCLVKEILSEEVGLKVFLNRFTDKKKTFSYPISIVIYNNRNVLGYFDPFFYELGFHERLMHVKKDQLKNIVRHELAHYLTFIEHGPVQSHGTEFKSFCHEMKWDDEVSKAEICLEEENSTTPIQESEIFRKIQKLLALTTSKNQYEAEAAMIKSQELLLKHHIDPHSISPDQEEEKFFLKRILGQKQVLAKTRSIAKILETFFVSVVFHKASDLTYLEILGTSVNIQIAEYVADILSSQFDQLWNLAKKEHNLRGTTSKNSFFLGIAKGYCDKFNILKQSYQQETSSALIILEKKLLDAKSLAYPRLSSSKSFGNHCSTSSNLGEKTGRSLKIHPGIGSTSQSLNILLPSKNNLNS